MSSMWFSSVLLYATCRVAHAALRSAVRLDPLLPRFDPCCGELRGDRIAVAKVHLVRSLPFEGRVRNHLVLLAHVEVYESAERVDGIQPVEILAARVSNDGSAQASVASRVPA
jgi:hypothetical protein